MQQKLLGKWLRRLLQQDEQLCGIEGDAPSKTHRVYTKNHIGKNRFILNEM